MTTKRTSKTIDPTDPIQRGEMLDQALTHLDDAVKLLKLLAPDPALIKFAPLVEVLDVMSDATEGQHGVAAGVVAPFDVQEALNQFACWAEELELDAMDAQIAKLDGE